MRDKITEATILLNQLKLLRSDVEKIKPETAEKPGRPGSGITGFIPPFNNALQRVKDLFSDDPLTLELIKGIEPVNPIEERLSASLHTSARSQILAGSGLLLAILGPYLQSVVIVPSMKVAREGVFFAGQYFDAIQCAADIFSLAQQSILFIDRFLDEKVFRLLEGKKSDVQIQIFTKDLSGPLKVIAGAFNKQHGSLSIRLSDDFHDRFVVIDNAEIYHFGASIKNLGQRGFMFSRVEDPLVMKMLLKEFLDKWNAAQVASI